MRAGVLSGGRTARLVLPLSVVCGLLLPSVSARYVRVRAEQLSERLDDYVFALAEVEVYSGQQNMAAGAAVTAGDSRESGIWSTRFVTDGFTSQRNVMTWPEYVTGLDRRRELETTVRGLVADRRAVSDRVLKMLGRSMLAIALVGVAVTGFMVWRNARTRRRDLARLRQRLARDIHDEIGSGLGTISLISQMGSGSPAHGDAAQVDFQEIHRISREVTESLRDIVWLIRPETRTVGDLAKRLEETAATMLAGVGHEFVTEPAAPMQIVTYNIQWGKGRDGQVDLERIARCVAKADVIALRAGSMLLQQQLAESSAMVSELAEQNTQLIAGMEALRRKQKRMLWALLVVAALALLALRLAFA
jgi:signal transduction histidine kinase